MDRLRDWFTTGVAGAPETVWAALISAVLTLALAVAVGRIGKREAAQPEGDDDSAACDFLVNGSSVRPLTGAARALLDAIAGRQTPLLALTRHLEGDCPSIREDIEGLVLFGASFRRHCQRGDGTAYEIAGRPRGGAAPLSIRAATQEGRALDEAERALAIARGESAFQQEALDRAPVLVWTLGPGGQVTWANAGYRERFEPPPGEAATHRPPNMVAHLLEEVPLTARVDGETRRRVKISCAANGGPHWFEVSQSQLPSGETLCFAVDAEDLVAAEASLRRFVETLTETFAHLPIGLAVFDKNRRLGLFNPALSDLVKIDAVWLAGRPSLRDFLERLRETRQMPEQKDFAAFRRMLTELEEGARDGTYEENWVLPSGKIFRVTGRPHPQGALAFLFEDISTAIQLERRYRAELELSQATLDRLSEAVAVFDTSGMLVFVNSAFEALWRLDPMSGLEGPGVADLSAEWERRCMPTSLWDDLRAFATGAERRTSWTGTAVTRDGLSLTVLVAPLPNGSTLVTFREKGHALAPADPETTREGGVAAIDEIEGPAQAALAALAAATAAAPDARAFAGLSQAAQALKDGLARARAAASSDSAQALCPASAVEEERGDACADLAEDLARALGARGLGLGAVVEQRPPETAGDGGAAVQACASEGRALAVLATALAGLASPGAAVDLAVVRRGDGVSLTLRLPAAAVAEAAALDPEPAGFSLARRRLAAMGATFTAGLDGGGLRLAADLSRSAPMVAAG
jgi:PAS domain-containing protein